MSLSPDHHSTRRMSPGCFPSHWPRRLSDRTAGLYKKANALFHLEGTKIAILVSAEGCFHGYLSHGPADWPELHQLVASQGITLTTPDNLDTVAQRYASRSQSVVSTASSSTMTSRGEHDPLMELLSTLQEEPDPLMPHAAAGVVESLPDSITSLPMPVWSPPRTAQNMSKPAEMTVPVALMNTEPAGDIETTSNPGFDLPAPARLPASGGPSTPKHAVGSPEAQPLGVIDGRVHKKRAGKGTRGVATRSHGSRGSKNRH